MTHSNVTDLEQWRNDHPPVIRLATISMHCFRAYWRMVFAAQSAAITSVARMVRF
jgi:hypothetical protein